MKRRAAAQSALFTVARNCFRDQGWHGELAPGTAYLAQDFLRLASCVVLSKDRLSPLVRIGDVGPPNTSTTFFPGNTPSRSAMVHVNSYLSDRFETCMQLYRRTEIKSPVEQRYGEKSQMKSMRVSFKRSPRISKASGTQRIFIIPSFCSLYFKLHI